MSKQGGRHEGRAGIRYAIINPTESGKTTFAVRMLKEWEQENPDLPVWSNIKIFNLDKKGNRVPDPQVHLYKSPLQWKKLKRGLLFADELSVYLNSLAELNQTGIFKALMGIARNLTKQDFEWIYTDQHALAVHKRVRINVNRVFAPSYEPEFHRINYYIFQTIPAYVEYAEGGGGHVTGLREYHFDAREIFPYFDTKEIITNREKHFNVMREAKKMLEWFVKTKTPLLQRHVTDAIAHYEDKNHLEWTQNQEKSIRYLLKLKFDAEKENNGHPGK